MINLLIMFIIPLDWVELAITQNIQDHLTQDFW